MTAILREDPPALSDSGRPVFTADSTGSSGIAWKSSDASRFQSAKDLVFNLQSVLETSGGAESHAREEKAGDLSVAVLYLDNLSRAAEDEYFRDGMTEDITTELTKIRSLRVFPRAAVAAYRDRNPPAREVGEQLQATHVLGGTLRRSGSRLRVTVQIVETRTGHSVWAERYDRELEDVFGVQEDIARRIAQALRITLSHQEDETISSKPTENLQAYDYFLRGRSYSRQQRREFALEMFERALALDPSFALAHAGIANICAMQFYLESHDERWLERAVEANARAFALDPELPEAFVARARILYARGEYEGSVEAARKAIALKHDCESAWDILGRGLFASDRWEEAAALVDEAVEANGEDYNVYIPYGNALEALGREAAAGALSERHAAALERQARVGPGRHAGAHAAGRGLRAIREAAGSGARAPEGDEPGPDRSAHHLQRRLRLRMPEHEGGSVRHAAEGRRGRLCRVGESPPRPRPRVPSRGKGIPGAARRPLRPGHVEDPIPRNPSPTHPFGSEPPSANSSKISSSARSSSAFAPSASRESRRSLGEGGFGAISEE